MVDLHESYVNELEFKLATHESAVRRAADCALQHASVEEIPAYCRNIKKALSQTVRTVKCL